jgi:hypothetical protein
MQFVSAVLERWRGATSQREMVNDPSFSVAPRSFESRLPETRGPEPRYEPRPPEPRSVEAPMLQPSLGLDPDRFSLLKKPLR